MSYQVLCPKCGRGFLEGTSLKDCPDCGVPLEHTAPAESAEAATSVTDLVPGSGATLLGLAATSRTETTPLAPLGPQLAAALASHKLPEHLDIDEFLRKVLAEQTPGENIDVALRRVVDRGFPAAAEPLYQLLSMQLDLYQQNGKTRQQAAEQLAHSQSELSTATGGHQIRSTQFTSIQGLEKLPAALRTALEKQLVDAVKSGKPLSAFKMQLGSGASIVGADPNSPPSQAAQTGTVWSLTSGPLLGMSAPAEFCSLALAELEAAGVARATERTARVDKLWASPRASSKPSIASPRARCNSPSPPPSPPSS